MRIANVQSNGRGVITIQRDGEWYPLRRGEDLVIFDRSSLIDALTSEDQGAELSLADPLPPTQLLLPPVAPARNVMCLGKNYRDHAQEFASFAREKQVIPEAPVVFTKPVSALCGPRDVIVIDPGVTSSLDYEVELGVVIGRPGAAIKREDALAHVAGYTVVNDVTARDLQQRHGQWFLGKSLAQATPVGPVVVTPDELVGIDERAIRCWVNGELRQSAHLADMIFSVSDAIAVISRIFPLERGDLIAMGTPSGVGVGFTPPRFLQDGDEVICEIAGIGRLENTVSFHAGSLGDAHADRVGVAVSGPPDQGG
jgi:2-keto-4-pentenoate hydratase/2-oxohepta-3-ene-1,7-dioic acid hydratase in catechol pathway